MIIYGNTLVGFAQTILRITGREEHSKTMDNKIKVLYKFEKGEIILARWSNPDNSIVVKTYDRSVSDWSVMTVALDIVESVRSAGIELEVGW